MKWVDKVQHSTFWIWVLVYVPKFKSFDDASPLLSLIGTKFLYCICRKIIKIKGKWHEMFSKYKVCFWSSYFSGKIKKAGNVFILSNILCGHTRFNPYSFTEHTTLLSDFAFKQVWWIHGSNIFLFFSSLLSIFLIFKISGANIKMLLLLKQILFFMSSIVFSPLTSAFEGEETVIERLYFIRS